MSHAPRTSPSLFHTHIIAALRLRAGSARHTTRASSSQLLVDDMDKTDGENVEEEVALNDSDEASDGESSEVL